MKHALVFLAMVAVLLVSGGSSALAQSRSEVLVIGQEMGMITSLDPAKGFEVIGSGVMAQVYDRLLDFPAGKFDKPEPSLAESWKVSPDGLVWTFNLRKDVKFHSGNPMTSEDVVYSFQRAVILKDQPAFILTQFGLTPESFKAPDPVPSRSRSRRSTPAACSSRAWPPSFPAWWIPRSSSRMSPRPTSFRTGITA